MDFTNRLPIPTTWRAPLAALVGLLLCFGCTPKRGAVGHPASIAMVKSSAPDFLTLTAEIRIAGKPAKLLVDTGAHRSFLTQAAVWYHGIRGSDTVLKDFIGYEDSAPLEKAFKVIEFESSDAPSIPTSLEVISSFSYVAGALAPFNLVGQNGTVVIDIRKGTIHLNPQALPKFPNLLLSTQVHRCSDRDPDDRRFSVQATIAGHTGWFLVDTGATQSVILKGQAFDAMIEKDSSDWQKNIQGVRGILASVDIGEHHVDIGQWSGVIALIATENPQFILDGILEDCEFDGVLGMDVLADCSILWRNGGERLACTAQSKLPTQRALRDRSHKKEVSLSSVALKLTETCGATRKDIDMTSPFPVHYTSYAQAFEAMSEGVRSLSEKLLQQCYEEGFVKARSSAKLERNGDKVTMVVGVHRGEKHRIGSIRIIEIFPHGAHAVPESKVGELVSIQAGSLVSLPQIKVDSEQLHTHYQKWARPYRQFEETLYLHTDEAVVDLEFRICLASRKQVDDAFVALCRGRKLKEPIEEWRLHIGRGGSLGEPSHEKGTGKIAIRAGCTKVWQHEVTMQMKSDKSTEGEIASRLLRGKLIERLATDHMVEVSDERVAELYGLVATQNGISEAELDALIEDKRGVPLAVYKRSLRQSALELRLGQFLLFKINKERPLGYPPEEVTNAVDGEIQRLQQQLEQARIEEQSDQCYELPPR